jgi:hypothetical protein
MTEKLQTAEPVMPQTLQTPVGPAVKTPVSQNGTISGRGQSGGTRRAMHHLVQFADITDIHRAFDRRSGHHHAISYRWVLQENSIQLLPPLAKRSSFKWSYLLARALRRLNPANLM